MNKGKQKKVAVWVAATPATMATMQQRLFSDWNEPMEMEAAGVQEDRNRDIKELDNEAFLQAYIEGVAGVLFEHILGEHDKSYTALCAAIPWPSLWLTKIIDTVEDVSSDFTVDHLLKETEYGVHQMPIQPTQLANNAATQLLVPVSVGAIQAGIAYLVLSVPEPFKDIRRELYMTTEQAYNVLDSFRAHHATMLSNIMAIPHCSVISSHAIHL